MLKLKNLHKQLIFPLILILFFLLSVLFLFNYKQDDRRFRTMTSEIFKQEMLGNTLNMHYTICVPSNFGIYSYQPTLPTYSLENHSKNCAMIENYLYSLKDMNPRQIDASYSYDLLLWYFQNQLTGMHYEYFDEPLSPSQGMQSQLPILLAEYRFKTKQDVLDYLSILKQVGTYFEGLLKYEQEKSAVGLFMSDKAVQSVRKQCQTILTRDILLTGTHFLQVTFKERVLSLCNSSILTEKEAEDFSLINDQLLLTVVQSAYEKLNNGLHLLEGTGSGKLGLCHYSDGRGYYEYLIRHNCGTDRNMKSIKRLLYQKFEEEYTFLQTALTDSSHFEISLDTALDASLFPLKDPDSMLSHLQDRIKKDFPTIPTTKKIRNSLPVQLKQYPLVWKTIAVPRSI